MAKNISHILIISESGRLRDSLRVLLQSCFPRAAIEETGAMMIAQQFLLSCPGALVLLDAALTEIQNNQALEQIGRRCVVLAHSNEQQKQAQGIGANAVLLDGFTTESLCAAVEAGLQR
jgi:DNA-binding NarL/FixJ family response regulator